MEKSDQVRPLILTKDLNPYPFSTWSIDIGFASDFSYDDLRSHRNGTLVSYIDSDGDYGTFYDARLKHNISSHEKNVLNNIAHLDIAIYNYRHTPSKPSFGFIAQNVKEYFAEVVSSSVGEDGEEYLGIAYGKVSVIAIKAIQEQQEIIESQKSKIEHLEAQMQEMQSTIGVLIKKQMVDPTVARSN